jgi:putative oxygen-independent coproporphyrinogen III oxidase
MVKLPPLSLYIHIPWCVQKCPYCDFNSHALKGEVPHDDYVQHLLNDLDNDVAYAQGREVKTIFIGGGTPSLLSGPAMQTLLDGVRARLPLAADAEITMEANPGTVEADRFVDYQRAGVNRISIGVQSFSEEKLKRLGRIHGPQEAKRAANLASGLGLRSFNLDLMHGLPDQSLEEALGDLRQAIELNPPHLSWYQLTIEPNTLFGSRPPVLPDDDALWDIFEQGHQLLTAADAYWGKDANGKQMTREDAFKKIHQQRDEFNKQNDSEAFAVKYDKEIYQPAIAACHKQSAECYEVPIQQKRDFDINEQRRQTFLQSQNLAVNCRMTG